MENKSTAAGESSPSRHFTGLKSTLKKIALGILFSAALVLLGPDVLPQVKQGHFNLAALRHSTNYGRRRADNGGAVYYRLRDTDSASSLSASSSGSSSGGSSRRRASDASNPLYSDDDTGTTSSSDGTSSRRRNSDDSVASTGDNGSRDGNGTSSRRRNTDEGSTTSTTVSLRSTTTTVYARSTTTTVPGPSGTEVTVTGEGHSFTVHAADVGSGDVFSVVEKWRYKDSHRNLQKFTVEFELRQSDIDAAKKFLKSVDRQLRNDHVAYARSIGMRFTGNDDEDTKNFYIAVCREFYRNDAYRLDNVVKGLEKIFSTLGFSQIDKFYFVTSMIQNMKYEDPGGEIGIFPPTLTLSEGYGDCDTKAILAYVILEKLGFDVVVMGSEEYSHAMLGVNIPASGKYLTLDGKKYYFLEMTYPDWSLGEVASDCNNLRYWYAFKLS